MSEKKNIAFLIYSLTSGGAERVLTTLANKFVNQYNVTIITLAESDSFYKLNPLIEIFNCGSQTNENSKFQTIKNHFKTLKIIGEIIKLKKIDLLIGFTTSVNVFTIIAARKNKIPSIISERNNPVADPPNLLWKTLRNFYYKYANYLVVQTVSNKQFFHKIMPSDKVVIIKNPIATVLAEKRILQAGISKDNIILSVGRLDANKAQDLLIKAYAKIPNAGWQLIIIGDGDKKQSYETLTKELNISDKVIFLGNISKVHDYYNKASIFVFTSKSEGFPNALAEALYFGIPSISTNCPHGPSDLIEHNVNGILIDVDDQIMLEKQLLKLINNDDIRKTFSREAIESTEKLNIDKVTNEWLKYLNKLI